MSVFKYDGQGVKAAINNLKNCLDDCEAKVNELSNIRSNMCENSDWTDDNIKQPVNDKILLEIERWNNNIELLSNYIKYLENKAIDYEESENSFK